MGQRRGKGEGKGRDGGEDTKNGYILTAKQGKHNSKLPKVQWTNFMTQK